MNLEQLRDRVRLFLRDPAFNDDTIDAQLNDSVRKIAALVRLPDLIDRTNVQTTSDPYLTLPANYHRDVFFVYDTVQNREIRTLHDRQSHVELLKRYPAQDEAGSIEFYAVRGRRLFYGPIPTSPIMLRVHYYRLPSEMTSDSDDPDGIPPAFHTVVVHHAAWQFWEAIEDGIEGKKVNTNYHAQQFEIGRLELREFVGDDEEPYNLPDESGDYIP